MLVDFGHMVFGYSGVFDVTVLLWGHFRLGPSHMDEL